MLVFEIVIEDKLINPVAGVSIPIIFEISMKGGMTIPLKSHTLDHGTFEVTNITHILGSVISSTESPIFN